MDVLNGTTLDTILLLHINPCATRERLDNQVRVLHIKPQASPPEYKIDLGKRVTDRLSLLSVVSHT